MNEELSNILSNCTLDGSCLIWQGRKGGSQGYGIFKGKYVHRLVYQITHPDEDITCKVVMHKCDNPPCCNPEHLEGGTQQDNLKDMRTKGRSAGPHLCGESNPSSVLTLGEVAQIREIGSGVSQRKLGSIYGVSQTTIRRILKGTHWKESKHEGSQHH